MNKPRALDLFCGAGGATKGLQRAGFHVTGVDIKPQPRYCGDVFVQADAMTYPLDGFDFIWASPPCQHYSCATRLEHRGNHPDLIAAVRERLESCRTLWCIENVPGAPIRIDLRLCGCMFGLDVMRERWFETSWRAFALRQDCYHPGIVMNTVRSQHGPWFEKYGRVATRREIGKALGVDWMNSGAITQAIPPAYSEFIGKQALRCLVNTFTQAGPSTALFGGLNDNG